MNDLIRAVQRAPQGGRASRSSTGSASGSPTRTCSTFSGRIAEETLRRLGRARPRAYGSRRPEPRLQPAANRRARARGAARAGGGTRCPPRRTAGRPGDAAPHGTSRRRGSTSFSGTDAPDVRPTTSTSSSSQHSSIPPSSIRSRRHPGVRSQLDEPRRVRGVARADHEQQVDLRPAAPSRPAGGSRSRNRCRRAAVHGSRGTARRSSADHAGRLVHGERGLRDIGELRPVRERKRLDIARLDSTSTTEPGISPIVPTTSSCPAWPIRINVQPHPRSARAWTCTLVTSGHVASIVRSPRAAAPS